MGISVEVHNLGPLESARIELADLNVLVGENNTGKSFFATVLHRAPPCSTVSQRPPMHPMRRAGVTSTRSRISFET